jgi:hypothetical protein
VTSHGATRRSKIFFTFHVAAKRSSGTWDDSIVAFESLTVSFSTSFQELAQLKRLCI